MDGNHCGNREQDKERKKANDQGKEAAGDLGRKGRARDGGEGRRRGTARDGESEGTFSTEEYGVNGSVGTSEGGRRGIGAGIGAVVDAGATRTPNARCTQAAAEAEGGRRTNAASSQNTC